MHWTFIEGFNYQANPSRINNVQLICKEKKIILKNNQKVSGRTLKTKLKDRGGGSKVVKINWSFLSFPS